MLRNVALASNVQLRLESSVLQWCNNKIILRTTAAWEQLCSRPMSDWEWRQSKRESTDTVIVHWRFLGGQDKIGDSQSCLHGQAYEGCDSDSHLCTLQNWPRRMAPHSSQGSPADGMCCYCWSHQQPASYWVSAQLEPIAKVFIPQKIQQRNAIWQSRSLCSVLVWHAQACRCQGHNAVHILVTWSWTLMYVHVYMLAFEGVNFGNHLTTMSYELYVRARRRDNCTRSATPDCLASQLVWSVCVHDK